MDNLVSGSIDSFRWLSSWLRQTSSNQTDICEVIQVHAYHNLLSVSMAALYLIA